MDYMSIINEFYDEDSPAHHILVTHCRMVARKALDAARNYMDKYPEQKPLDMDVIENGAMLHDIGICKTRFPGIGLYGEHPYLMHGVMGREILEAKGLFHIAPVCERHVGVGITAEEIRANNLPLPERDMIPLTVEEKIIAYADKFYSKDPGRLETEKRVEKITAQLARFGNDRVKTFLKWHALFN